MTNQYANRSEAELDIMQENDAKGQTGLHRLDLPRKRKGKSNGKTPLDSPVDEAVAQHLAAPKSIREFRSFSELAGHFEISRMTVYRRTKDPVVLQRAEWLLKDHKLAGDLVARLHWERIVAGQVKAAVAGDTKAAAFCKQQAWPDDKDEETLAFFRK